MTHRESMNVLGESVNTNVYEWVRLSPTAQSDYENAIAAAASHLRDDGFQTDAEVAPASHIVQKDDGSIEIWAVLPIIVRVNVDAGNWEWKTGLN